MVLKHNKKWHNNLNHKTRKKKEIHKQKQFTNAKNKKKLKEQHEPQ